MKTKTKKKRKPARPFEPLQMDEFDEPKKTNALDVRKAWERRLASESVRLAPTPAETAAFIADRKTRDAASGGYFDGPAFSHLPVNTKAEYLAFHRAACARMHEITAAKNSDYTTSAAPFSNFTNVEALGIASTETGFLTRMVDKISRIASLVQKGEGNARVKDESLEDTILDLSNYAILLAGYLRSKRAME